MYKLSVSIPVYNRPECLEILLRALSSVSQDNIEVCISDNNDQSDCNEKIVDKYRDRINVKYVRNETNIGMVKNIIQSVEMASGEYVWLMGDDDFIIPEELRGLLTYLEEKSPDFLLIPYEYMSNDYRYSYRQPDFNSILGKSLAREEFVGQYLWMTGFIGANLFKNKKITLSDKQLGLIEQSPFPHVIYIMLLTKELPFYHVYSKTLCFNRSENTETTTWAQKYFDIYWGWEETLNALNSELKESAFEEAVQSSRVLFNHRSPKWVISRVADGVYNRAVYEKYYKNLDNNLVFLFLLYFPRPVAKFLKLILKTFPRDLKRSKISILK